MGQDITVSKSVEKIVGMIAKLEPQEFIGVCKILGVKIYDIPEGESNVDDFAACRCEDAHNDDSEITEAESTGRPIQIQIRSAEDLIVEVIEKVNNLNRTQRRNLLKLLKPATKGR